MVTQVLYESGHVILWISLLIGYFMYVKTEITHITSGRNGVQMETLLGRTYAIFIINIVVAITLVIYPLVMYFTGVHWLWNIVGTLVTLFTSLIILLLVRETATSTVEVLSKRVDGRLQDHSEMKGYKLYKVFTWVWVAVGVTTLSCLHTLFNNITTTLMTDIAMWASYLAYLLVFYIYSTQIVEKVANIENGKKGKKKDVDKNRDKEN